MAITYPNVSPRNTGAQDVAVPTRPDHEGHADQIVEKDIAFTLITTRAQFNAIEQDWNELYERVSVGAQVFQSFNWLWHWCNHFAALNDPDAAHPFVLLVHRKGRLVQIWPLAKTNVGPVPVIKWMGEPVSQYGDIIAEQTPDALNIMRQAWEFLRQRSGASVIHLKKVRDDAHITPLLKEVPGNVIDPRVAPYVNLAQSTNFNDIEKTKLSGNRRRNRNRQRRRLYEQGVKPAVTHSAGQEAKELAEAGINLKRQWLRRRALPSSALGDPRTVTFFRDICETSSHPIDSYAMTLATDTEPVAVQVGMVHKGHVAMHIIVHDHAYDKSAAGSLILDDSIRHWHAQGATTFDLLAPGDTYKLEWADDSVNVYDFASALTIGGMLYTHAIIIGLRNYGYKIFLRLPHQFRLMIIDLVARMRS